jgi:1,4-dihydroxy-2-naphthoate octaprenyltransferase
VTAERSAVIAPPGRLRVWLTAARPRTLTVGATPVVLGTALAWSEGAPHAWLPAAAALLCALLIQAATNMHNDAADFERGNDTAERIGPLRVTAAGWATPREVHTAALATFAAAFGVGAYLVFVGGWPILAIGIAALAAGWAYSGGPRPISHTPLGELFVFLFFGLLAVAGSHWLQAGRPSAAAFAGGAALGSLAAAVLMLNNYRDLDADRRAGRRTLAAILGPRGAQLACAPLLLAPFAAPAWFAAAGRPGALLAFLSLPPCIAIARRALVSSPSPELNQLLAATARAEFAFGALLAVGMSL